MTTKKSSVKTKNKEVKEVQTATVVKTTAKKPAILTREQEVKQILSKIENLEKLKNYYGKLKVKCNKLKEVHERILNFKQNVEEFESEKESKFPFRIVLQGLDDKSYNSGYHEIFTINKKSTVENYVKYLVNDIEQVLELFEIDIIEHSKKV